MSMTDPIADLFTRIRNAQAVRQEKVEAPSSRIKREIAELLKQEGYLADVKEIKGKNKSSLRLFLKYGDRKEPVISGLERVSSPGRRVYVGLENLPKVLGGLGIAILTTPKGILSDRECRAKRLGGEVLGYVW